MDIDQWLSEYKRGWNDCRHSGEHGECDLTLIDEMRPTSKSGNTQTHPYWRGFYDAEHDIKDALYQAIELEHRRVGMGSGWSEGVL